MILHGMGVIAHTERQRVGGRAPFYTGKANVHSLKKWPQFHVSHFLAKQQPGALCSQKEETALFYTKIKQKDCLAQAEQCRWRWENLPHASEEMKAITSRERLTWAVYALHRTATWHCVIIQLAVFFLSVTQDHRIVKSVESSVWQNRASFVYISPLLDHQLHTGTLAFSAQGREPGCMTEQTQQTPAARMSQDSQP